MTIFEKAQKAYPADMMQLTSLRFFVAFLVMFRHYIHLLPIQFPTAATGLDVKSPLLVDFFFILSGFILTHVYQQDVAAKTFSFRDYWIRRLARVYPVYLFTFLATIIVSLWARRYIPDYLPPGALSPLLVLEHIFLVQGWGTVKSISLFINLPGWSISVEWFIYIFFPFLLALLLRGPQLYGLLAAFILYEAARYVSVYFSPFPPEFGAIDIMSPLILVRSLAGFLTGMALCRAGYKWQLSAACSGHAALMILAAVILGLAHVRAPDMIILPLLPLLILVAAEQARRGRGGLMVAPPMVYLGKTAYSLYMVHYMFGTPVLSVIISILAQKDVMSAGIAYALWASLFPVALIAAILTYEFVEKPGRNVIVRNFSRRKTARKL